MTGWHVLCAVVPVLLTELGLLLRELLGHRHQLEALEQRVLELERKTACLK